MDPEFFDMPRNSKEEFRAANPQEVPTEAPTTPKPYVAPQPVHHFKAKPATASWSQNWLIS